MPIPFGPQLVGETEKTLRALLGGVLNGTDLTEPQWVTLRLAQQLDGQVDADGLAGAVTDRAHFPGSDELVRDLSNRGLLDDGRLTSAGRDLVATVLAKSAARTGPIWDGLPIDDVEATTRILNEVLLRARAVLS